MGITINNRLRKAMAAYLFWKNGDGDMGELAVSLYDLAGDYQALLEDYRVLEGRLGKNATSQVLGLIRRSTARP